MGERVRRNCNLQKVSIGDSGSWAIETREYFEDGCFTQRWHYDVVIQHWCPIRGEGELNFAVETATNGENKVEKCSWCGEPIPKVLLFALRMSEISDDLSYRDE